MDLRVEYSRAEDAAYIYLRTVEPGARRTVVAQPTALKKEEEELQIVN
jgi:hypothetical protein